MISKLRMLLGFKKPPSVRRCADYREFDRAVKAKEPVKALALGERLLGGYPNDKLLRRRMAAVAHKAGKTDQAQQLLLAGLPTRKREHIVSTLDLIAAQLDARSDAQQLTWRLVPKGTQSECVAFFYPAGTAAHSKEPCAVAKVLNLSARGHRRELGFWRLYGESKDCSKISPKAIGQYKSGLLNLVLVLEYVNSDDGHPSEPEQVVAFLDRLHEYGSSLPTPRLNGLKNSLLCSIDLAYVLLVYLYQKSLSLRYLTKWLHSWAARKCLFYIVKKHMRPEIPFENRFADQLECLLSNQRLVDAIFVNYAPVLVHGDLNAGNLLPDTDAAGDVSLCAIDWENWGWAYPEIDLARFCEPWPGERLVAFSDAHFDLHSPSGEASAIRFLLFSILARLFLARFIRDSSVRHEESCDKLISLWSDLVEQCSTKV